MSPARDGLRGPYAEALKQYLATRGEAELARGYEIGRQAIGLGLGVVDLVSTHQHALAACLAEGAAAGAAEAVVAQASEFLLEALAPAEMTLRGFADAVEKLTGEVAERKRAEQALQIAHAELERRVRERTAELSATNERLHREIEERIQAETALCSSEQHFRSLVATVRDYAIILLTPEGKVASWNAGAARIKGHRPEDIIGRSFAVFYTAEDQRQGLPQLLLERAAAEGAAEQEGWRVRRDGSRFWADVVVTPLRAEDGTLEGFTKVTRDMTERRLAEETQQRMNIELQRTNEEKDRFVAIVSHELRSPLAAIVTAAEVLHRLPHDDERGRRAVEIIQRNALLQKRLADDLLDLSRLAGDRLTLQRAPAALDTLVRGVAADQEADAAKAGVTLVVQADPGLWVLGDPERLQQIAINLLSNALKFTPAGGRVEVRAFRGAAGGQPRGSHTRPPSARLGEDVGATASEGRDGEWVCLEVEDTGMGIETGLLAHVFDPFRQGEIAGRRQHGLGLGLALVKLLAEKHGGHAWAQSDGPSQGSRFTVVLPALRTEAAPSSKRANAHIRLLLVEDNEDTRVLLHEALEALGYEVSAVGSGEQALEALRLSAPDLILSDLGLPGIDGYELLRRARELGGVGQVPAFAITGQGLPADVQRARDAGFLGHFLKPVDVAALDQAIRAWLEPTVAER